MTTLYELLGISEDSGDEQIKAAYNSKINDPNLTDKRKNQLRIAVDILLNKEKRDKYNIDLANYRAQELLKGINVNDNLGETNKEIDKDTPILKKDDTNSDDNYKSLDEYAQNAKNNVNKNRNITISGPKVNKVENSNVNTSINTASTTTQTVNEEPKAVTELEEKAQKITDEIVEELDKAKRKKEELEELKRSVNEEEYKKILKKQEALDKKERKRAEREYKEKYQEAYVTELRNRGYNVKYPWTWKRIKNLLITIIVVIVVCFIGWQIPAVRNPLVEIYETNGIVRMLVNMVGSIFKGIFGIFKKN